jgi:hypothetical protein
MSKQETSARVAHILGNYEIFDELGRGGMGIVYRGLDLSLDRPVAVKVLRDELRMQSMIVNRFAREARAAAALDHPNIVQIYSVGESNRTPYIAMELVEAEPLSALMIREKRIPWERSFAIAEQVAAALASAHEAQIIHRDVKPPNILLTEEGCAYVTDFGIAKILSMHDQLTLDGTKLGTPQYMSPERCKTGDATASSDIYSLGVVLFQMISGRLPYEGASAPELIKRITSQPPARLREYAPDVPDDVERLVAWFIERRPEQRPATAEQAREAIDRVREGKPLDTAPAILTSAIADFRDEYRKRKRAKSKSESRPSRKTPVKETHKGVHAIVLAVAVVSAAIVGWIVAGAFNAGAGIAEDATADIVRWYAPRNAASFLRESDAIWMAHLADPALQIERLAWNDHDGSLLVVAQRHHGTGTAVTRAMLAVDPIARFARAAAVQLPDTPNAMLQASSANRGTLFTGRDWAAAAPVGARDERQAQVLRDVLARTVGEAGLRDVLCSAVHPFERRMFIVVETRSGEQTLYEGALAKDPLTKIVSAAQVDAAYAPDGTTLVFATPDGIYLRDAYTDVPPVRVQQGPARLADGALHPQASFLLRTVAGESGGETIQAIPLDDSQHTLDLGPGFDAQWLGPNRIVFLAKDARGAHQVWSAEGENFSIRRQLSFIEGGITGPAAVSGNGAWLAAKPVQSEGNSAVVLIRLTGNQ